MCVCVQLGKERRSPLELLGEMSSKPQKQSGCVCAAWSAPSAHLDRPLADHLII